MTNLVDDKQTEKQSDSLSQQVSVTSLSSTKPSSESSTTLDVASHVAQNATVSLADLPADRPQEHGGQAGLEPTRYGDWEKKGRCTDF